MRNDRLLEMEKVIGQSGTISMTELCDLFNVSMNTVRRDVAELRRRGDVEKVYGGVCAVENNGSVLRPFTERRPLPTRPSAPFAGKPPNCWKMGMLFL